MPLLKVSTKIPKVELVQSKLQDVQRVIEEQLLSQLSDALLRYSSCYTCQDPKEGIYTYEIETAVCDPSTFRTVVSYLKDKASDDVVAKQLYNELSKE